MTDTPLPSPTRLASARVSGNHGERTTVVLEDGTELTLATDAFLATGLRAGDPVDEQLRAGLVEAGLLWEAREAGLRLLSHRARSRRELETRLRRKGFPGKLVSRVAGEMEERGYLDDDAFARAYVSDRLRLRPRGRRALERELRGKGVDAGVAEAALERVFQEQGTTDADIAREVGSGWVRRQPQGLVEALLARERTPEGEKALRRFQGFMGRRGITGGVALQVLEALREGS
ncbi:MAG TPA: RecX family transcriptional regulator [Longimicrobiales bacterium]|nr:RecX family transcriptional regulator [Longimicrobiales bacterium]